LSQLLTLYITPVFYIYMERARTVRRRKPKVKRTPGRTEEFAHTGGVR